MGSLRLCRHRRSGGGMIALSPGNRILVQTSPVHFSKGINGLSAQCREVLMQDPHSGTLFAFRNKQGTAIKLL